MATRKSKSQAKLEETTKDEATSPTVVSHGKSQQTVIKGKGSTMSEQRSVIEYDTDLNEAEAPVPLPKGDYAAEIRASEIKVSNKGNDYVNVTFFIAPEQYPADYTEGNPDGMTFTYGRLSPANDTRARYGMKKFCEAIGAELGKTLDLDSWLGKSGIVTIVHEDYEGETRAKISKVKEA